MGLPYGGQVTHIAANATKQVKNGPGNLHTVTINSKGGSSNTLTIYDNTGSDTTNPIAVIDTTAAIVTLTYDAPFANGIKAVLGTGTAADVTLVWS